MRLFVALRLDAALLRAAAVQAVRLQAADTERAVRWVDVSGMHLTLQFLGEVPDDATRRIGAALDTALVGLHAPRLALARAGAFPNLRRPRVIWLGLREKGGALAALHRAVGAALGPLGWPPDVRPFQPHLTVGRVRDGARPGRGLVAAVEGDRATAGAPRPLTDVVLFRSHLGDGPARYERLRTWDLQGSR